MVYEIVKNKYEEVLENEILTPSRKHELIIALASSELFINSEKREKIDLQLKRGLINSQEYIKSLTSLENDIEFDVYETLQRIIEENGEL